MKSIMAFAGSTLGGYLGWWLGAYVGFIAACYMSLVGMGIGLYVGRRLWQRYRDDL